MDAAQLINQDSGKVEYYTPAPIVNRARAVMGHIDLDPASSAQANLTVQATRFFAQLDDGLTKPWQGNIWMNHPFGRGQNKRWISKLVTEFRTSNVTQACCITFASTSESWFAPLYHYPMCFLSPRTNYYLPNGQRKTGVTKGSVITYLGPKIAAFVQHFADVGHIMLPYHSLYPDAAQKQPIQPSLLGIEQSNDLVGGNHDPAIL